MAKHVPQKESKIGALLPVVSGHLGEKDVYRTPLVVRKGETEILRKRVHELKVS
jgi:hypothetical protein